HSIWYTESVRGMPLVWIAANNNSIFAYNALTGDLNLKFDTFNPLAMIPGSHGFMGTQSRSFAIDEERGILVAGSGVSDGTQVGVGHGRWISRRGLLTWELPKQQQTGTVP